MKEQNLGVIIEQRKTDHIAGAESGIVYESRLPSADWSQYLPDDEMQKRYGLDTMACVTFSALNSIETQVNFLIASGLVSDQAIKELTDMGYLANKRLNLSDRFTAKMSGTTPDGNSFQNVWDSIRHDGALPESDWPFDENETSWDRYYSDIPQEKKDKAKIFLKYFDIKYEWIWLRSSSSVPNTTLTMHLRQSPIQIAGPICPGWRDSEPVQACSSKSVVHATMIYANPGNREDLDHYEPFKKELAADYFIPCAMKAVVTAKSVEAVPPRPVLNFQTDMRFGDKSEEVAKLQKALAYEGLFSLAPTGYYGDVTRKAVRVFLEKYDIANWMVRLLNGGRYVGPATRAKLNELFQ